MIDTLGEEKVRPLIGRAVTNRVQSHFYSLNSARANKLGGKRTNFYSSAAKSTQFQTTSDGVTVSINKQGIRQRLQGGVIRPKNAKYLTIPAIAEAYGRRAREFSNLEFGFAKDESGDLRPALVEAQATLLKRNRKGRLKSGGEVGGKAFYWLGRSADKDPDPSVLPTKEELQE